MYSESRNIVFHEVNKKNTEITVSTVLKYCAQYNINSIFIASSTGYTVYEFLKKMRSYDIQKLFVFTQYLDENHFMTDTTREELANNLVIKGIYEIPQKYLNKHIGQDGVDSLRELSHGIKVCVEITHFANENSLLKDGMRFVVVTGRVEGADTAVAFEKREKAIKMIDLLCFSKDE